MSWSATIERSRICRMVRHPHYRTEQVYWGYKYLQGLLTSD